MFAPVVIERLKKIELPKRPPPAAPPPAPEPIVVPSTALTVYEGKDERESEGWMFCLIGIAAVAFTALIIFCATSRPQAGLQAPLRSRITRTIIIETRPLSAAFLWGKSNEARSQGRPPDRGAPPNQRGQENVGSSSACHGGRGTAAEPRSVRAGGADRSADGRAP